MENIQINPNDYYINNNLEKVNNFINHEIGWLNEKCSEYVRSLNFYDKILFVIKNRKIDWCYYFSVYCSINNLCDKMKHQFEYLIYYCSEETVDYVIAIMIEVFYHKNNIDDANIITDMINNRKTEQKNKKYSETLKHLVYTDTPCNYNLEYPMRLYNIIELLPFRDLGPVMLF